MCLSKCFARSCIDIESAALLSTYSPKCRSRHIRHLLPPRSPQIPHWPCNKDTLQSSYAFQRLAQWIYSYDPHSERIKRAYFFSLLKKLLDMYGSEAYGMVWGSPFWTTDFFSQLQFFTENPRDGKDTSILDKSWLVISTQSAFSSLLPLSIIHCFAGPCRQNSSQTRNCLCSALHKIPQNQKLCQSRHFIQQQIALRLITKSHSSISRTPLLHIHSHLNISIAPCNSLVLLATPSHLHYIFKSPSIVSPFNYIPIFYQIATILSLNHLAVPQILLVPNSSISICIFKQAILLLHTVCDPIINPIHISIYTILDYPVIWQHISNSKCFRNYYLATPEPTWILANTLQHIYRAYPTSVKPHVNAW